DQPLRKGAERVVVPPEQRGEGAGFAAGEARERVTVRLPVTRGTWGRPGGPASAAAPREPAVPSLTHRRCHTAPRRSIPCGGRPRASRSGRRRRLPTARARPAGRAARQVPAVCDRDPALGGVPAGPAGPQASPCPGYPPARRTAQRAAAPTRLKMLSCKKIWRIMRAAVKPRRPRAGATSARDGEPPHPRRQPRPQTAPPARPTGKVVRGRRPTAAFPPPAPTAEPGARGAAPGASGSEAFFLRHGPRRVPPNH